MNEWQWSVEDHCNERHGKVSDDDALTTDFKLFVGAQPPPEQISTR